MLYVGYFKYICQNVPQLFIKNNCTANSDSAVLLDSFSVYYVSLFLKYSYFFKKTVLVDMGGYDLPASGHVLGTRRVLSSPVLWYIFKELSGGRLFIFSFNFKSTTHSTIEALFRNARWLEREATDFFGFFFTGKTDRRSLFTLPLFYNAPFKRKYPVLGLYELFFCPILKKLKFKHLAVQV